MDRPYLLIIEDDENIGLSLRVFFEQLGYQVDLAATGPEGLETALRELPDVVITDLKLPGLDGIEVLEGIKREQPDIAVLVMTGYGEVNDAVRAMKEGADYYFQKPIDLQKLRAMVEKSAELKRMRQHAALYRELAYPIVGRSEQTQSLIHLVNLLAANPHVTVLIQGESGTGKELVARNIHAMSTRSGRPFIELNCAALPESILESEIFGYEAGAFTDAKRTKQGLFELAGGGTVFLDEIGDMPLPAQAKILRVLETRTMRRLGGTRDIMIDVRIVAATNKDLMQQIKSGHFREDLYYRLNVMLLTIPPLRERPDDIPMISERLLEESKNAMGKKLIEGFSRKAIDLLSAYHWPGNVRELRNVIERAVILCPQGHITEHHISLPEQTETRNEIETLADVEKEHILKILKKTGGNRSQTAKVLGIARSTLNEKIRLYRIV